jgi:hypothetical protein
MRGPIKSLNFTGTGAKEATVLPARDNEREKRGADPDPHLKKKKLVSRCTMYKHSSRFVLRKKNAVL